MTDLKMQNNEKRKAKMYWSPFKFKELTCRTYVKKLLTIWVVELQLPSYFLIYRTYTKQRRRKNWENLIKRNETKFSLQELWNWQRKQEKPNWIHLKSWRYYQACTWSWYERGNIIYLQYHLKGVDATWNLKGTKQNQYRFAEVLESYLLQQNNCTLDPHYCHNVTKSHLLPPSPHHTFYVLQQKVQYDESLWFLVAAPLMTSLLFFVMKSLPSKPTK